MIAQVARIDPRAAELITKFTYQPPRADPNVRIVLPWEPQVQVSQPASSSSSSAPLPPARLPWNDPLSEEVMSLVNPEVPTCLPPPPRPPPADETNEEVRAQWGNWNKSTVVHFRDVGPRARLTPGELRFSKQLVQFLRRNGAHEEFEYSTDWFFSPEDIMNHFHECDRRELTPQTLIYIAQNNDKARIMVKYNPQGRLIGVGATHGRDDHMRIDEALFEKAIESLDDIPYSDGRIYHGTTRQAVRGILRDGLIPGGVRGGARAHNHCAPYPPGSRYNVAGMRYESAWKNQVTFHFDVQALINQGVSLYQS